MDTKRLQAIQVNETNRALSSFALRHSVGLGLYSGEYPEIASGTLLRLGSRYFIATAAHCIRKSDLAKVRVAYREKDYSTHFTLVRKGTLGGTAGDPSDVGYIEVDKSVVERTPAEFLTLDHIAVKYDAGDSLAFLFGFPAELVPKDEALERRFRFSSLGLLTIMATTDSIPEFVNSGIDVFVQYPEEGMLDEQAQHHPVPQPEGVSGGSIWIYNPNLANPIVGVHNARFIGIQKSWLPSYRIAIGNKVSNLLKLLCRDYPDLTEGLNDKFGTL